MYHSSKAARDRDRLRESVLRDLGWKLHRIWGTDWYRNRAEAIARLKEAVEEACAQSPHAVEAEAGEVVSEVADVSPTAPIRAVEFVSVAESAPTWVAEYKFLSDDELEILLEKVLKDLGYYWLDLQNPEAAPAIALLALVIIDQEGPIEEDLIIARVRSAWSLSKAGTVIQRKIRSVLKEQVKKKTIVAYGTAYDLHGREVSAARTPTSGFTRKVGQVPAIERQFAMRKLVEDSPGMSRSELMREVARFFGWARTGPDIKAALTDDFDQLVAHGVLVLNGDSVSPGFQ